MTDAMYGGPDPRERGDGLGQLLRALFPDPRVWLDVARAPRSRPPRGWKLVAAYALVPNASTPRFLVPLGDRRVASASLFAYLSLRSWKVRASRAALGATARAGVMRWWPSQLRILVPDDIASSDVVLT